MPIRRPVIPLPPHGLSPEVSHWFDAIHRELYQFFDSFQSEGVDKQLRGVAKTQVVVAGFTIDVDAPVILLSSASAVTSSVTALVKTTDDPVIQLVCLINIGSFIITLSNGAGVQLGGSSVAMGPNDVQMIVYAGNGSWYRVAPLADN